MVYILNGQTGSDGPCLSCYWHYTDSDVCPPQLVLAFSRSGTATLSIDFAGRGQVGGYCGGSDSYVTFFNNPASSGVPYCYIDVWQAHRDGIWSSSVTIDAYCVFTSGAPALLPATAYAVGAATFLFNGNINYYVDTGVCPATASKNFTFFDDGTIT